MGTIVKRGDSWRAVIRKKGHPVMTKTFSKQVLAKRWVQDTEYSLERQDVISSESIVGTLVKRYIKEILPSRPTTDHRFYKLIARWTGSLSLGQLDPESLLKWKDEYCPDASPMSFERYLATIWGVLRDAEAFWGTEIPLNVMRKTRTFLKRIGAISPSRSRDRRPVTGELDRIKVAAKTEIPLSDIIDFAAITAMRLGEITQLRWDDLDQTTKMILVRNRKHPTRKIGNHCNVPLLFNSIDIVLRQPRTGDLIFPYQTQSITVAFSRAKKLVGLDNLRLHDLRHEAISCMFEKGFSITEVALVSGHRNWASLKRYTNLKPESLHAGPISNHHVKAQPPAEPISA